MGLRHLILPGIGVLFLAGCAGDIKPGDTLSLQKEPEVLCAPTQDVRDLYATVRTVVGQYLEAEDRMLKNKKLTVAELETRRARRDAIRELDFDLKMKIENPKSTVDTEKIIRILRGLGKGIDALT